MEHRICGKFCEKMGFIGVRVLLFTWVYLDGARVTTVVMFETGDFESGRNSVIAGWMATRVRTISSHVGSSSVGGI